MELYIIKSAACLIIFFVFYKLLLEEQSMHSFKRYYLLGSLLLAFGIPLITFTEYIETQATVVPILTTEFVSNIPANIDVTPNYLSIALWSIYIAGVLFFLLKFGSNLIAIIQKIRKNPHHKNRNIFHVLLKTPTTPHTFFRYIFLNKKKFEAQEIPREVLLHEETHAKQMHSLDVLIIELIQIVFWFNPVIYFIKKSIKLNHEFLADSAVLEKGIDTSNYQNILLAFSSNAASPSLANSINYSFIKKRFTVMKTHTSKRAVWLRSLFLLPIIALALYGFSNKEIREIELGDNSFVEDFHLTVDAEKNIYHLEKLVAMEDIPAAIARYKGAYPNEEIYFAKIDAETKEAFESLHPLIQVIRNSGIEKITSCWSKLLGATPEELFQYNKLAKKYNAIPKAKRIVPGSDLFVLETIYRKMSDEQRTNAQPFPECDTKSVQEKATDKQIKAYNAWAKKLNSDPNNMFINEKELMKMEYIYSIMTAAQRKASQPFPNIPPPPPPPAPDAPKVNKWVDGKNDNVPPPPPPPPAPDGNTWKHDKNSQVPPPPPPAPNMKTLAEQGATFYYEGEKISSDKAIQLYQKNKKLNIQVNKTNTKNPVVKLSTKPIQLKKSSASLSKPKVNIKNDKVSIKTGNVKIKGENYFYSTKNGSTSYFNEDGKQVDKNGNILKSNSKKNPVFYYNGKQISSQKANKLLSSNTSIAVKSEEYINGAYNVYLTDLNNSSNPNNYNHNLNVNMNPNSVIDLTKVISEGATFFYGDQKISTEKALELTRSTNYVEKVEVVNDPKGKPKVYLWKKA